MLLTDAAENARKPSAKHALCLLLQQQLYTTTSCYGALACVLFAEHADAVLMIYSQTQPQSLGTVEQCADIFPQVQDTTCCHAPMWGTAKQPKY